MGVMADSDCEKKTDMIVKVNDDEPMENENVESTESTANQVEEEDVSDEDFQSLNTQLDALNTALDALEQRNDNVHAQLVELLHANREARRQFLGTSSKEDNSQNKPSSNSS